MSFQNPVATNQTSSPEVERAIRELMANFSGAIDPLREDVVAAIEDGVIDPSSTSSIRAEVNRLAGNYTNDLQAVYREGTERGAEAGRAVAARRHQLDIAFDVVPDSTLEEFGDWSDEIVESEVLETLTEDVTNYVRGAHEEGLSIDELADAINDELFDGRLQDHVAERNARTATISSSNAGNHSALNEAPGVVGEQWLASLDGRERDTHAAADGQVVAVNNTFEVGGYQARYPGDPNLPVGEIANCRCAIVPVFRDDLSAEQFGAITGGERIWL